MKYDQDSWIQCAKEKYGAKYIYDEVLYIDSYNKVLIRCAKHNTAIHIDPISFLKKDIEYCYICNPKKHKRIKLQIMSSKYKFKACHKETGFCFIAITNYPELYTENKDFIFEETDLEYGKPFCVPNYLEFPEQNNAFCIDQIQELKYSQIKLIRDSLLEYQNNVCLLCKNDIEIPALDHYHSKKQHGSGLVRGVLCNTCNRMTGVVENNLARNSVNYSDAPEFLKTLADYLQHKREPYLYPSERKKKPKLMKSSYNKLVKLINKKQKVPKYSSAYTKELEKLFKKYDLVPELK